MVSRAPMGRRVGRSVALGLSLVCAFAIIPAAGSAASGRAHSGHAGAGAAALPGECPEVMPVASVHEGQKGSGWTVEQGQLRERFKVKVLGILPDGIAAGRDLIVVKVSDTANNDMIARAGGIWAGMSGSPVYVDGKLIGSISYGFSASPSPIGGVTPAQDIVDILSYGNAAAASTAATSEADRIALPESLSRKVAAATGTTPAAGASLSRLVLPLSVSGLSQAARERLQGRLDTAGYKVLVTPGSRAQTPAGGTFDTPVPGGNFAGMLSYGDVTAGGIGTTTYVCGDQALAFGHPLLFAGKVSFGANNANAITVIRDDTFGPFKMASVGNAFGKLDQDRLSGIRAALGESPSSIPITADVTAPNLNRHRIGETDVTMSMLVPFLAPEHLFQDIISTFDKQGGGSSLVHWTATGRRSTGETWSFERTNRFASSGDIAFVSADELYADLSVIFDNPFERVRFDSISIDAEVINAVKALFIDRVLISKDGGPFKHRNQISVHPGTQLTIRALMSRYAGGSAIRDISLTIPSDASGVALLGVFGGGTNQSSCQFDPSQCGDSFDELLDTLANLPQNNDLVAQLFTFDSNFEGVVTAESTRQLNSTVFGGQTIQVNIH